MQLHDVQIIITGSNAVNRYQNVYQHQSQVVQNQTAIAINDEANIRRTQIQEVEARDETKEIQDTEERMRQWKKEHFKDEEKRRLKRKLSLYIKKMQNKNITADKVLEKFEHIIDIKV